jgi:hypothetical protein
LITLSKEKAEVGRTLPGHEVFLSNWQGRNKRVRASKAKGYLGEQGPHEKDKPASLSFFFSPVNRPNKKG